ncbi:MAG TPA: DEAD/DEAH box helicase [Candidatus Dojkabacteria bacterium]|nr:DEAD/DEAH box helicase [Candidatus Dojkabacteria bacterium]HQF36352.1 DEAD/DEAH box helicase [Candidatus Dojkabacteria bacterium]
MNNYRSRRNNFNSNPYRSRRRSWQNRKRFKPETITIDQLISKAVNEKPINIYVDDYKYSQFDLNPVLIKNIYHKGYSCPTQIQFQAIPEILKGKDVLGLANTGSGKTSAFLIPMINKVIENRNNKCLIIVPTRELAMQIQDELRSLSQNTGIKSLLIIGGNSIGMQIAQLRKNPEFVICTPGRLKDLFQRKVIILDKFNNVILDEVDRMLDMGFINDIKLIIEQVNSQRQSLFFAATMNKKAEGLANSLLTNPVKIQTEIQSPGKNVDQDVIRLEKGQSKLDALVKLLSETALHKVLIFTSTKREADRLRKTLNQNNHLLVDALHGDKRQNQRTKILYDFKTGKTKILIATDVASRGIDVNDISHVINYDMPNNYDDYIHRIGRTGRAGKKGFALTFV